MFKKMFSQSLAGKIILITLSVLIVVVSINYFLFVKVYSSSVEQSLVEKAAGFTSLAEETKNHVSNLQAEHVFDIKGLLADLAEDLSKDPNYDYTKSRIFGTIPVVAGWTAAGAAAEEEGLIFKVTAFEARNPDHDPRNDSNADNRDFRTDLFTQLQTQFHATGEEEIYAINKATNTLHFMRAIKLDESCMMCHGKPGDPIVDPNGDGKDPLGFDMENWAVGDMHGAFELQMPLAPMKAQIAAFTTKSLFVTAVLVGIGSFVVFLLTRRMITTPITKVLGRAQSIAQGDLTGEPLVVKSKDEIGLMTIATNDMRDSLATLITSVQEGVSDVAAAATEIAASSEQIAVGMEQQQRQTSQVAAAIEEMSASVIEVSSKAGDAATKAEGAGEQAVTGGEVVTKTVEGMRAISEQVDESAAAVGELGKRGEEIGEIIGVINDIADQTNLLALNAAIEAARAGEHGRGFAVVADEVRKLAERTTTATEEVGQSIRGIQDETTKAVDRMQSSQEKVTEGVSLAEQAGQALGQIVSESQSLAGMIQSIASAAEQQSAASTEVSQNVDAINAVTNESTEGVRQAAQAAVQLSTKSEELQGLVSQFKLS